MLGPQHLLVCLCHTEVKLCSHANRMGAMFHAGEGICHCIVPIMNMTYVRGVFQLERRVDVVELLARANVSSLCSV